MKTTLRFDTKPANVDAAVAEIMKKDGEFKGTYTITKETTLPNGKFRVELDIKAR